jgi:hypothetical protein
MKYMKIDNTGRPTAFYSKDVHPVIPPEAIEITDKEWQYALANQGKVAWDSETGGFIEIEPDIDEVKPARLESLKENYMAICLETDNEVMKYSKRWYAGIDDESDAADYEAAVKRYKDATLKYRTLKAEIENAKIVEEINAISTEIE